jgi:hypothetical protein
MIDLDPWYWKLLVKFSIKSLQSRIPQFHKVSITNTSIVKGASGQAWKAILRSLMMPRVKPPCMFCCDILRTSWCITLSFIMFLGVFWVKHTIMEKEIIDLEGNRKRCRFSIFRSYAPNMVDNGEFIFTIIFLIDL